MDDAAERRGAIIKAILSLCVAFFVRALLNGCGATFHSARASCAGTNGSEPPLCKQTPWQFHTTIFAACRSILLPCRNRYSEMGGRRNNRDRQNPAHRNYCSAPTKPHSPAVRALDAVAAPADWRSRKLAALLFSVGFKLGALLFAAFHFHLAG